MKRKQQSHAERAAAVVASIEVEELQAFGRRLRAWYRKHARDLPWRKTRDPYHVLVSELMLQQTQVSRVIDYYARFLDRFPTVHSIAEAPIGDVLEAWEGLGYYARARNLHKLAHAVTPNGVTNHVIPSDPAALRGLPGIGAYTAGAVASFAYELRAPLVDTNVARLLLRVFAPEFAPKSALGQRVAWALAEATLPRSGKDSWTHNQALIELGALVCTARVAYCERCPHNAACEAFVRELAPTRSPARAAADIPLDLE